MSNSFWYICLIVISVGNTLFTMYKKRNILTLISCYFFATGIAFLGEEIVLIFLKAYKYKPEMLSNRHHDNLLGHVICNAGLLSSTAIIVVAFSLRYRWIFLMAVIYMLIEVLFLKLGIYIHHWWRTYITGITLFIYLSIVKIWFTKLKVQHNKLLRYITFYFISYAITVFSNFMLVSIFQKYYFSWGGSTSTPFHLFLFMGVSLIYMFFVFILQKWYWKLAPLAIICLIYIILLRMNILIFNVGWNLIYHLIVQAIGLTIIILLEKYTLKSADNSPEPTTGVKT
jgi:hypothetical protein